MPRDFLHLNVKGWTFDGVAGRVGIAKGLGVAPWASARSFLGIAEDSLLLGITHSVASCSFFCLLLFFFFSPQRKAKDKFFVAFFPLSFLASAFRCQRRKKKI
jgi:hypothetical protein